MIGGRLGDLGQPITRSISHSLHNNFFMRRYFTGRNGRLQCFRTSSGAFSSGKSRGRPSLCFSSASRSKPVSARSSRRASSSVRGYPSITKPRGRSDGIKAVSVVSAGGVEARALARAPFAPFFESARGGGEGSEISGFGRFAIA